MKSRTHHHSAAPHSLWPPGRTEFSKDFKYPGAIRPGHLAPENIFGVEDFCQIRLAFNPFSDFFKVVVGPDGAVDVLPKRVPASKDLIRAAPFSNNNWMLFSFWRLMFSMVKKVKIGSRTATAPINTQGGTPIQDFLFLVFLVIKND
jgi:hypothetical protein